MSVVLIWLKNCKAIETCYKSNIDGLLQDYSKFIAAALESLQTRIKP